MDILHVKTEEELMSFYYFISRVFYEDSVEHNEHYHPMYNQYNKLVEQYNLDKELILYIEEDQQIIGGIAIKDVKGKEATGSVLAVSKENRGKGLSIKLLLEVEKRLIARGIETINLGARIRACAVYLKAGYKPMLLVQVSDFAQIDLIKKNNIFNFEIINEYQTPTNGAVFFNVDTVEKSVVDHFEKTVPTANASYIFTKKLG